MADQQQPKCAAQPEKDKSVLVVRMIRVVDQLGTFIDEDSSGFLKANAVLLQVGGSLPFVPLEAKCAHIHMLTTM